MTARDVVALIGVGDMGVAIARRIAPGRQVVLADRDPAVLASRVAEFEASGHDVTGVEADVTDAASLAALAAQCAERGVVRHLVHTAGVSPATASVPAILAVDLLGTALVLDAFEDVIAPGGSGLVVASMAAALFPQPSRELERALALTPSEELLALSGVADLADAPTAYAVAKQGNILRVAARAAAWGRRGARLNAVSPGIISTAMGRDELDSENGPIIREMVRMSGSGRVGTADDVADAAAFLLSDAASFITGTNLLVDGGVRAATWF